MRSAVAFVGLVLQLHTPVEAGDQTPVDSAFQRPVTPPNSIGVAGGVSDQPILSKGVLSVGLFRAGLNRAETFPRGQADRVVHQLRSRV